MAVRHPRLSYQLPFLVVRHKAAVFSSYATEAGGNRTLCHGQISLVGAACRRGFQLLAWAETRREQIANHGEARPSVCFSMVRLEVTAADATFDGRWRF